MAEAGIFDPEDRVELVDVEVVPVAPVGTRHPACGRRLADVFHRGIGPRATVSVRSPSSWTR